MEQLKELLTSSDWAAKKAKIAIKLTEDFKSIYKGILQQKVAHV